MTWGTPFFMLHELEISIDADVDRTGATSLPTLIEAALNDSSVRVSSKLRDTYRTS